ncbi:MAG TPA: PAS domain-containing protein [Piscinibacter sp.]|jgi:PAS domain S-box-containing protein|uniref:sensor histidine kinase n=1 Tax=Piscinibacter sp. TaxID=1903157 RepID=UPI001B4486C4|nr:PAS domain-containing protein [Piscinibacter sp.]MBP6540973.1 PAS domain-containing protein [Piscinibacter sp.]HOY35189.1 PAS domain-containing protein [Piscinibacter sp.]HPG78202.1 PAS domain-containing protein [Piscinibacter sp.]HPM65972.1 PAS domain-containing protein [Piscinibacter sp.]
MDEAGRITETLMRDALLGAGTAVWEWEIGSDRLSNTDASAALLGYAPGEIGTSQQAWDALIHPEDVAANHAAYLCHVRGEVPIYEHEYRARTRDGSWRWIAERGRVVERAPDGTPLRMVGTLSDITLRREAQGTALEMAERLLKISRHVPGIVFQFRNRPGAFNRGYFPFVSESVIDLLGVSPQTLTEDAGAFFRMVERDDRAQLEQSIVDSGRMMRPWRCEFRIFRRGAPARWLSGTATPQAETDGTVTWHGYLQDVTDQRELDRVREAAAAAQAANRAKTDFLSRMSHELRTPLNAVLGFAQLLELDSNAPLNETQRRRVELIREAGTHLLQMIGELLDLTRIESGQIVVTLAALPLAPLLADCVEFVRAQADAAGVVLHFDAEDSPWSARADATRLRQVVLNLLGNGIKYNRAGGSVRLRVRADRELVVLLVSDTGVGIAAADLPTLFEPFHRGAHQHSAIEGAGIGLAVTRSLVELMGGRIDVVSVPGQGSTFSVTLAAA